MDVYGVILSCTKVEGFWNHKPTLYEQYRFSFSHELSLFSICSQRLATTETLKIKKASTKPMVNLS